MSAPQPPANPLLHVLINLLTPTFLQAANEDLAQARAAALQALRESGATTGQELIAAAQAIALGIAAITTIAEAMQPDQPLEAAQRRQTLAIRLSQTADRCRRSLSRKQRATTQPRPQPPAMAMPKGMSMGLPTPDPSTSALWAAALSEVAQELLQPTSHPGSSAPLHPPGAPS